MKVREESSVCAAARRIQTKGGPVEMDEKRCAVAARCRGRGSAYVGGCINLLFSAGVFLFCC